MSKPRRMPTTTHYSQAIQNLKTTAADVELQSGVPIKNAMGLPLPYSGNFAVVYQVKCISTGKTWAVKCFTKDAVDRHQRYEAISAHLKSVKLPFMVQFQYQERGILVGDSWYPIVKMEWIEGQTLNEYVLDNMENSGLLNGLLLLWVKLAGRLTEAHIAHADIQHDNVLLVPKGDDGTVLLRLIDYDGMWVPTLSQSDSGEIGHSNYQHPDRSDRNLYVREVDRFSHLVICSALACLRSGGRDLWRQFDSEDNLLFTAKDFRDPSQSELFQKLWNTKDIKAKTLVGHLILACQQSIEDVPVIEKIVQPLLTQPLNHAQLTLVKQLMGEDDPIESQPERRAFEEIDLEQLTPDTASRPFPSSTRVPPTPSDSQDSHSRGGAFADIVLSDAKTNIADESTREENTFRESFGNVLMGCICIAFIVFVGWVIGGMPNTPSPAAINGLLCCLSVPITIWALIAWVWS